MNKLPNHTALKEWSSVIASLAAGETVVLIRKGGIADPRFGLEADRFYLYPTYFHSDQQEPESVTVTHWCEVVRTWRVSDPEGLEALVPFVAMPREALETRYRFRPDQALHVIGVRTFALASPAVVDVRESYLGCRSWVSLDDEIDVGGSRAVLAAEALRERLDRIDAALAVRS
jgi:hypothetical protein